MTTDTKIAVTTEACQPNPEDLRTEARRLLQLADDIAETETRKKKGLVFVATSGAAYIHTGAPAYDDICASMREATVHEVDALYAAIPEFAVRLDEVRGQA